VSRDQNRVYPLCRPRVSARRDSDRRVIREARWPSTLRSCDLHRCDQRVCSSTPCYRHRLPPEPVYVFATVRQYRCDLLTIPKDGDPDHTPPKPASGSPVLAQVVPSYPATQISCPDPVYLFGECCLFVNQSRQRCQPGRRGDPGPSPRGVLPISCRWLRPDLRNSRKLA
jgi:hypothetical protein